MAWDWLTRPSGWMMQALTEVKLAKFYMLIMRIALSLLITNSSAGMLAIHTLTAPQLPMPEVTGRHWCLAMAVSSLQQVCCIFFSLKVAPWPASIIWSGWRAWRPSASGDAAEICLSRRPCRLDCKEFGRSEWDNSTWISYVCYHMDEWANNMSSPC